MEGETIIGGPLVRYTPDADTIFMVIEKVGTKEVSRLEPAAGDETEDYWVEKIKEIILTDAMTVYQVPTVEWMSNWKGKNGALTKAHTSLASPKLGDGRGLKSLGGFRGWNVH